MSLVKRPHTFGIKSQHAGQVNGPRAATRREPEARQKTASIKTMIKREITETLKPKNVPETNEDGHFAIAAGS